MTRMLRHLLLCGALLTCGALLAAPASAQTITYPTLHTEVGSGLQTNLCRARLSDSQHGGITVRIASADTNLVRITADDDAAGGEWADVFIPQGSTDAVFYAQAVENTTGAVDVTASAPGFAAEVAQINVVTPSLRKLGLPTSIGPFDPVDPFYLQVGVANPTNTAISSPQDVRVGGPGLTTTLTVTDPVLAELEVPGQTGSVVTLIIPPGASISPTSLAQGGAGFDALAPGVVGVIATAPGFNTILPDTALVTITPPAVSLVDLPVDVGAGLQAEQRTVRLSGSAHGGVTVHIEVADSTAILVAPDGNTAGSGSIDLFVPDGQTDAKYTIQAFEGVLGSQPLSVTAPGFGSDVATVEVRNPAFRLLGLGTSLDTLDPPDQFYLTIGVPNAGLTTLALTQPARIGGPGVVVTATSSDGTIGLITTSTTQNDTVSLTIPPGDSTTPTSFAAGGFAFDGVGVGTTTVAATIPGFVPVSGGAVDVTVTQPGLTLGSLPATLGAGLRSGSNYVYLTASQHGGVTVRVASADPGRVLVSAHADSVGESFVDIFVPNGSANATFYAHGLEGVTGVAALTASSPLFLPDTTSLGIVQPGVRLIGLTSNIDTIDPPDLVYAIIGAPNSTFTTVNSQEVRPGSAGVPVDFTVADPAIGTMIAGGDTAATVTVTIPAGSATTPTNLNSGGAGFRGLATGTTSVTVTAPGTVPGSYDTDQVTVNAPVIVFSSTIRIGAGLQEDAAAHLSAGGHGGTLVTLTSTDPGKVLVAPNGATVGQATIDVFVADGATQVPFTVQAIDGTTGTAELQVSAPQFTPLQINCSVEQPGVRILSLGGSLDVADNVDVFYARVGIPSADNSTLLSGYIQERRAGQSPLVVTFLSSNGAAAGLVTNTVAGPTLDLPIPAGSSTTQTNFANGAVALDGLAEGQTVVTAAVPGFIQTGAAQIAVDITNQNILLNGLASRLGAGLQSEAVEAVLGETSHGGVTMTVSVSDTNLARIAANALDAGSGSMQFSLPNGATEVLFYVQALEGAAGQTLTVTADVPGFNGATQAVDLVAAAAAITQLADSMDVNVDDDEFILQLGAITADGTGLETVQAVRGGSVPRAVTVRVDNPLLAQIADLGGAADSLTVLFAPGMRQTAATVAGGGLAFDPRGPGTVVVSASGPGIVASGAGQLTIQLTGEVVGVGDIIPAVYALGRNYPNPFNPRTTIAFELARPGPVALRIYDVAGRAVRTLIAGDVMTAGRHETTWSGRDDRGAAVAAGVYFYRLEAGAFRAVERMTLVK